MDRAEEPAAITTLAAEMAAALPSDVELASLDGVATLTGSARPMPDPAPVTMILRPASS